jgi:formylglycine-generating enzyme required for sulfatase activity
MLAVKPTATSCDFPDDPRKWDGWSKYRADNPYERLCLDARTTPTDEQIHQHCTALLQWWKNKLPLKNQPSNPLAQLLGRGIDDASRYLIQARLQLLDPERRQRVDEELAARARQETLDEFAKFVGFSIVGGVLTSEAEANLTEFGQRNGVGEEQIRICIEEELRRRRGRRAATVAAPPPKTTVIEPATGDPEKEFIRILALSEVDMAGATYSVRGVFARIADSLGIDSERAEDLLDAYLEEQELSLGNSDNGSCAAAVEPRACASVPPVTTVTAPAASVTITSEPSALPATFRNTAGASMVLLPPGEFLMGSVAIDAAPNEAPLTPVRLSQFYISQHPITNAQYERFDATHKRKRMEGAGDEHPVVYVTSLEAIKYCHWLNRVEGRKYRLPTEAEWEYAARGTDGRVYPWGSTGGRELANFADASTNFPWRDPNIDDGYPETSPVGSFPRGASFFGLEDMAGNVWEWCLDFLQPLSGTLRQNPRGPASGTNRVYRGGSWKSRFSNLRATARASNAPEYSCNDLGFRVVCECE